MSEEEQQEVLARMREMLAVCRVCIASGNQEQELDALIIEPATVVTMFTKCAVCGEPRFCVYVKDLPGQQRSLSN